MGQAPEHGKGLRQAREPQAGSGMRRSRAASEIIVLRVIIRTVWEYVRFICGRTRDAPSKEWVEMQTGTEKVTWRRVL